MSRIGEKWDLGDGYSVSETYTDDTPSHVRHFVLWHDDHDHPIGGFNNDIWVVTGKCEDGTLDVTPSLASGQGAPFSFHGFIRNGKWVPA